MSDSLIQALPDLVAFIRRDGVISSHLGGRRLAGMPDLTTFVGRRLDEAWPAPVAQLLQQMLRRALASRGQVESRYVDGAHSYEVRISPQGRERVLCIIRQVSESQVEQPARGSDAAPGADIASVERRGFLQRMKQSIADAALREQPLSLCMIHLGGLATIGETIDFTIAEQVTTSALQRLPGCPADSPARAASWYVGQLGDGLIAAVISGAAARETVRSAAQSLCDSLGEPVALGDAAFYLSPCAGIAILGEDALKPTALLEHARVALAEARRSGAGSVHFYSDTLRMRVGVRLDFEHELRKAIAGDQIGINYVGRHDLASGRLEAVQAYLCWRHPMRGEVTPAEFLPIAASTGLAMAVSQCALARLRGDVDAWRQVLGTAVKLSFGPLRHHLVSEDFLPDIERLFQSSGLGPGMIEIRIAEKTLASLGKVERLLSRLTGLGATIAIDEFGRGTSSLARIAALPVHALQIDRRFVLALGEPPALRFCKGVIALARSYGLVPIAPGVDSAAARRELQGLGYEQGLGDCFSRLALPAAGSELNRQVI